MICLARSVPIYGSFFGFVSGRLRSRQIRDSCTSRRGSAKRSAASAMVFTTPWVHVADRRGRLRQNDDASRGARRAEGSKTRCVLVNNPTLTRAEFYDSLVARLWPQRGGCSSKTRFLEELQRFLEARLEEGDITGLVIDEAQSLPYELLEEIRLLGNIESSSAKLLNIVLSGQPELLDRLRDPLLEALKQRIALRCELKRFDRGETASYIAGRLRIAGGLPQDIFTQESVLAIHEATGGFAANGERSLRERADWRICRTDPSRAHAHRQRGRARV